MNVIYVATEAHPFIKVGGLGDVIGALPHSLVDKGIDCSVILPKYQNTVFEEEPELITSYTVRMGTRKEIANIYGILRKEVMFYFIENSKYFNRDKVYGYSDDIERFLFFDIAAIELIGRLQLATDILHLHDWQTAMIAMLHKEKYCIFPYYQDIKIIYTIHNLAYQGKTSIEKINEILGFYHKTKIREKCYHNDHVNIMKGGITYSDFITTVSPTYAEEILTEEYGENLHKVLQKHKHKISGVLNGMDKINPYVDKEKKEKDHFEAYLIKKKKRKIALQEVLQLQVNARIPIIGMVSRLKRQKGIAILLQNIESIIKKGAQCIVMGTGNQEYELQLNHIHKLYPTQVAFINVYDEKLSYKIFEGADILVMPTLYESCGLSQMIALQYGTIPIIRKTGKLEDSVRDYQKEDLYSAGFYFEEYDEKAMLHTMGNAMDVYRNDQEHWRGLMYAAMHADFSWKKSAEEYLDIYHKVVEKDTLF